MNYSHKKIINNVSETQKVTIFASMNVFTWEPSKTIVKIISLIIVLSSTLSASDMAKFVILMWNPIFFENKIQPMLSGDNVI